MFHDEPIINAPWVQVVIQFLISQCALGIEIKFPGLGEAITGIAALLDNPEGMFKTDENGYPCNGKKL